MEVPSFDAKASTITVETQAVGMLAKLAHDLSISAVLPQATVALDGEAVSIVLEVPVDGLRVVGVRKDGAVDRGVLSASDRADIEKKIRKEVLPFRSVLVKARAPSLQAPLTDDGTQTLDVELEIELGKVTHRVRSSVSLTVVGKTITARGRAPLDLPRFGITPPKGPLGAFRVKETVDVDFALVFAAA